MKININSIPPKELLNKYVHVREKASTEAQNSATDKAELTSEAKTFSAALNAAKEAIQVRTPQETQRVNEVRQKVEENTYSVSGKEVAKKILNK